MRRTTLGGIIGGILIGGSAILYAFSDGIEKSRELISYERVQDVGRTVTRIDRWFKPSLYEVRLLEELPYIQIGKVRVGGMIGTETHRTKDPNYKRFDESDPTYQRIK